MIFNARLKKFKAKKLKKLSSEKIERLGGMKIFQRLGVEINFLTFNSLVNEYIQKRTGKDENMLRRAEFFNDTPVKSIKPSQIE